MKKISAVLVGLIFIQIFYGGLMAGNKAALFYPTFPEFGSDVIPKGLFTLQPWMLNFIQNVGMIQVIHRTLGFIVAILIFYFYWNAGKKSVTPLLKNAITLLPVLVVIQVLLGILTLINSLGSIPVVYGVLHQMVALLILTDIVVIHFQLSKKSYRMPSQNVSQPQPPLFIQEKI
jgi:cytochrome c oxidase assembly protein subunit 15